MAPLGDLTWSGRRRAKCDKMLADGEILAVEIDAVGRILHGTFVERGVEVLSDHLQAESDIWLSWGNENRGSNPRGDARKMPCSSS